MSEEKKWVKEADKYKDPNATFSDKLSNFWYYHKYHVIIAVVAVAVLIYLSTSLVMKEKYDYEIICVLQNPVITRENGDYLSDGSGEKTYIYEEDSDYLKRYLESVGDDLNGDGKVTVSINYINIEENRETATEIQKHKEQILTALRTGECMILLGDKTGFDFLSEADALEDLSSLTPVPLAYDGKALLLNDRLGEKIGRGDEDIPIYIGLRVFNGTLAQMSDQKKEDFANAEKLIENILS